MVSATTMLTGPCAAALAMFSSVLISMCLVTSTKEVMFSPASVCLSVFFMKCCGMTGHNARNNPLVFE